MIQVNTSKNAGELSSLTFLPQVIKDNYEPGHSQNTGAYEPNHNSGNQLFKVAQKEIITEKLLR